MKRAKRALNTARKHFSGFIPGDTGGRTDNKPMHVAPGSHVIPSDIVSSLGQGNSQAGAKAIGLTLGMGPYGTEAKYADGGEVDGVPIVAASGEIVVPPDIVNKIGKGDQQTGHDIIDAFIKHQRSKAIKTLKSLPGPKAD